MDDDEKLNMQKMHDIIAAIASEVQQYQNYEIESNDNEKENQLKLVLSLKSKLKYKNEMISILKQDLSTACVVARTVAAAKEKQGEMLKSEITKLQEESITLNEKLKSFSDLINELNNITDFVNRSYEELQNTDTALTSCSSVIEKLREIVLSCTRHYATSLNIRETCSLLQRKNRFLINKIYILESNLESLTEQLKHQQFLNNKQQKDNNNHNNKPTIYKTVVAYSDLKMKDSLEDIADASTSNDCESKLGNPSELTQNMDLTSHFTIVKKLLNDQDTLSKDLTVISENICSYYKSDDSESVGR